MSSTGTDKAKETRFSAFFREATPQEREIVFEIVMKNAFAAQDRKLAEDKREFQQLMEGAVSAETTS